MQRLQQGSQGQDVQRWQAFLIAQGLLAAGEADGIFGPKTKAATSSFQGKHGLEADGIVGPNTLARANALGFEGKLEPSQSQGLGASSRERLAKVHPQLAQRITKLAAIVAQRAPHITPVVTSGVRTFAEQDELFAQGRTKPGPIVTNARAGESYHNYGLSVDMATIKDGNIVFHNDELEFIGKIGEELGLEWGGRFTSIMDRPHLQLTTGLPVATCLQLHNAGQLRAVWNEIDARLDNRDLEEVQGDEAE